jgi:hypothetical protein
VLEEVIEGQTLILPVRRLALDGQEAWQEVLRCGSEGLVAKDANSPSRSGRTLAWRKVKVPKYREVERGFYKPSKETGMADRWRLTCACGRWRGFTETDVDAHRLAREHEREKGTHVVKIESRADYRRRQEAKRPKHPRSV